MVSFQRGTGAENLLYRPKKEKDKTKSTFNPLKPINVRLSLGIQLASSSFI